MSKSHLFRLKSLFQSCFIPHNEGTCSESLSDAGSSVEINASSRKAHEKRLESIFVMFNPPP